MNDRQNARRWAIHNLIGRPASTLFGLIGLSKIGDFIHDVTDPTLIQEQEEKSATDDSLSRLKAEVDKLRKDIKLLESRYNDLAFQSPYLGIKADNIPAPFNRDKEEDSKTTSLTDNERYLIHFVDGVRDILKEETK